MVVPFLTLYLTSKEMHRTLGEAGFVMGLFGLGAVIGAYFGGRLTDKIGFHKVQLSALLLGGIMFVVLGQIRSYPLICACTFLLSLVNESFRPANSSAIAFYSKPENRTRSYSLNRLSINLGWAVGGSIGGVLASFNYELLFWVDGLTNIGAALLLFSFLKPDLQKARTQESKAEVLPKNSAYSDTTYLWFIFFVTLFAFCFFQLFTTVPKYFRDEMHLSERYIGFIMAVNGLLIVALEMIMVYSMEGKRKNLVYINRGVVLCAFSFPILLLPGNAKFISLLMILFVSIGEIVSMPFMNSFWISRTDSYNRGQYAALYTIAWGMAQTTGPFLCSYLVEASNFTVLFVTLCAILLISAAGFSKLNKKTG